MIAKEFLSDYANVKATHIPGQENKFENLFGWENVNDVINNSRPSYESVRLVYEKQPLPYSELSKLGEWLEKGATLVINHTHQIDPINEQFAESLTNDVNAPVNINCYVSFPSKQGFDCHYDTHDVFIVHTAGVKSWCVFEPIRKFPIDRDPDSDKKLQSLPEDAKPYLECQLTPGDVLYIPRGHWHYAISEEPCIHLTVSHSNRSGIDYLTWLLNELRKSDEFLRQDFPLYQVECLRGNIPDDNLEEHIEKFKTHILEIFTDNAFLESIIHWVQLENVLRRKYQLPELALIEEDSVTKETKFSLLPNQKMLPRYDAATQKTIIISRGGQIVFNGVPPAIIEFILNSDGSFCGKDLQNLDPDVSWDDIQSMLITFYRYGLILYD